MIHGYFRVDLDIVWEIVEKELPVLREKMATLLCNTVCEIAGEQKMMPEGDPRRTPTLLRQ